MPGSSLRLQLSQQGAWASIDAASERISALIFSPACLNKLQSKVRFSKKTVRSLTAVRRASAGLQASDLLFSSSRVPSFARHRSTGFGRSPPSLTV